MVFGYSTNAFVKHSLLDSLEMIARIGFKGVEIMCDQQVHGEHHQDGDGEHQRRLLHVVDSTRSHCELQRRSAATARR